MQAELIHSSSSATSSCFSRETQRLIPALSLSLSDVHCSLLPLVVIAPLVPVALFLLPRTPERQQLPPHTVLATLFLPSTIADPPLSHHSPPTTTLSNSLASSASVICTSTRVRPTPLIVVWRCHASSLIVNVVLSPSHPWHRSCTSGVNTKDLALRNKVQQAFMNNSRLGIPVAFSHESLHGGGAGSTVYPMPMTMVC